MGCEGNDGRYLPLRIPPTFAFSIVGLPHLEPQERAAAPVRCRLVFADQALVSSLQNLPPRLQAIRSESPSREDQPLVIVYDALELRPALTQRQPAKIPAFKVQAVEGHVDGRGGHRVLGALAEPLEAADELIVEDRHFPVEDQPDGWERPDGGGKVGKPMAVVLARPADELDVPAVLVGDHAPSVVLLFEGPADAVEGLINLDGLHRSDLR